MTTTPIFNTLVRKNLRPVMQILSIPPFASCRRQLQYQIQPCLDGRASAYPGLLWRSASGSVVIKQEAGFRQWFYGLLKPWHDYIPAERQMDDMLERIAWALAHPDEARRIAEYGMATVDRSLNPAANDVYIRLLLRCDAQAVACPVRVRPRTSP